MDLWLDHCLQGGDSSLECCWSCWLDPLDPFRIGIRFLKGFLFDPNNDLRWFEPKNFPYPLGKMFWCKDCFGKLGSEKPQRRSRPKKKMVFEGWKPSFSRNDGSWKPFSTYGEEFLPPKSCGQVPLQAPWSRRTLSSLCRRDIAEMGDV